MLEAIVYAGTVFAVAAAVTAAWIVGARRGLAGAAKDCDEAWAEIVRLLGERASARAASADPARLAELDAQLEARAEIFNARVRSWNDRLRTYPDAFVARLSGAAPREPWAPDAAAPAPPDSPA